MSVVIVDTGVANLASVQAAFDRLRVPTALSRDPGRIGAASRLVLPGVGSFGTGMRALQASGADHAIRAAIDAGTPLLAICLGMQLLARGSEESPGVGGLGVIDGVVRRLPDTARLPHLGWNRVVPEAGCRQFSEMDAAFANSYALRDMPAGWRGAWTTHRVRFVSGVARGGVMACQFHPELSGSAGQELVAAWLDERTPADAPPGRAGLGIRLVPCLDVEDGRVVKGVRFAGLRDVGDPAEFAGRYAEQGADEIVMLDIAATPGGRRANLGAVRRVRRTLAIPLTVGGGINAVADARQLLQAGADKVAVNSGAVRRPALLTELAEAFGRQCVVLAVDARRDGPRWEVLVNGGRERTGRDAVEWMRAGEGLGAGEILLTSWDRDGTGTGPDLPLLAAARAAVGVPVIASGGIGSMADAAGAVRAGADAVLTASLLHDGTSTVGALKRALDDEGIPVRR